MFHMCNLYQAVFVTCTLSNLQYLFENSVKSNQPLQFCYKRIVLVLCFLFTNFKDLDLFNISECGKNRRIEPMSSYTVIQTQLAFKNKPGLIHLPLKLMESLPLTSVRARSSSKYFQLLFRYGFIYMRLYFQQRSVPAIGARFTKVLSIQQLLCIILTIPLGSIHLIKKLNTCVFPLQNTDTQRKFFKMVYSTKMIY